MKKYISYLRVSTKGQERSGLGLEAQRAIIQHYAKIDEAEIEHEFIEAVSGKDIENRPKLMEAIKLCNEKKYIFIVAKLDRLSRDIEHIFKLKKLLGENFKSCDLPDTDTVTLGIYAIFAQREREIISIRTKVALEAKKKRGEKMGNPQYFTQETRELGGKMQKEKAIKNINNKMASGMIARYNREEYTLEAIAQELNNFGFRTVKGKLFNRSTVWYLIKRQKEVNVM